MISRGQSPHSTSLPSLLVNMKKRDTLASSIHLSMFILNSQNFSSVINTLSVCLFPAILEGTLFRGILSEKMVALETVRYLHRTYKSLLYNKIPTEHYFPARATTIACIPVNVLHQLVLFRTQQGPDHMLITHTEPDSDN